MKSSSLIITRLLLAALAVTAPCLQAGDWPAWRGPNANGIADAGQNPPTHWSESRNIRWKTELPGRSHSSPILVGDRIYLSYADEAKGIQGLLALRRADGTELWRQPLHRGQLPKKIHKKNTHASPTPASDGNLVYVSHHTSKGVILTALTPQGTVRWQQRIGDFQGRFGFGYAPSPLLYRSLVIVSSEDSDGYLAAYRKDSGAEAWRTSRPGNTSYSSPIVARIAGRDQLLLSGGARLTSYAPATGKLRWQTEAGTKATCGTVVWEGDTIFASGGFPKKETVAVKGDGSGQVLWKNKKKCYEQSLLVTGGHVYALDDGGIAHCWRASDGREMWAERLGGPVSSSPVLVGDRIYATNERGQTFVFRATPDRFELIAQNQLGDEAFATPAFVDGRIYHRAGHFRGSERREVLYCIGQ